MYDKNYDDFFDEAKDTEGQSEQLMKMVEEHDRTIKVFSQGMKASGKISRIGREYAFVEIGAKNEAMIKIGELMGDDDQLTVKEGDVVEAFVVSNREGEIMLSKSITAHTSGIEELKDALNDKIPVQGKVTGVNKGGLNVKVMGHKAFCPISQIDVKFTSDVNEYLGKTLDFVITRITEGGRNIVISRIPVLEQGLKKEVEELKKTLENKTVLKGKISKVADFGLFVQIGNLEGLVHISEVSWERAENLSQSFSVGQDVEVVILKIEEKGQIRDLKLSLSIKQVIDNPWNSVSEKLSIGEAVEGTVTRLADFGAFVEIMPGIEGLVHVSEMSWGKRVNHPSEVVKAGQKVKANVLNIDEKKRSVSLSLKDVSDDPWNDIENKLPVGNEVTGMVAKKAQYGYFIDLLEGITGLLVNQNISSEKKGSFKQGDTVSVRVDSIDSDNRRISLSMGMAETEIRTEESKKYMEKQEKSKKGKSSANTTEFGAALLSALKSKK
ncbi:30S ribosomal protein S1p [Chitinispirillum alkaliphilum]|nr:30S ribosomal protein S1p [Chitinispirillum alkaliphilum]